MSNWYIYSKKADFFGIGEKYGISPVIARVMRNRDIISDEEIDEYLNGDDTYMHDPFLLSGIKEACGIIKESISNNEKIRIMGDYDIDGVCSSYILKRMILSLGGDADIAIPNRVSDGYGMNEDMVREAFSDDVKLIITCDNGIKAYEAVEEAEKLNIKVIITDHHQVPDILPSADVVINPHIKDSGYPYTELCGAAVAYKLIQALSDDKELLDEALMFAGIATIGDVVPLKGENRIFAKEGIKRLRNCTNAGLNALIEIKEITKENIDSYHIGFIIGPCINSAGRLKDADIAIRLLEQEDINEAYPLAKELVALNDERKLLTDKNAALAEAYFNDIKLKKDKLDKILVIYMPEAHESIVGIIASRLKERFNRPAFVITDSEQGLKGSGRSVEAYDMIGEISKYPHLFKHVGGHKMACGFTLADDSIDEFRKTVNDQCMLSDEDLEPKKWIDMQLPVDYLSEEFIEGLEILKPFGNGNAKPLFADKDLVLRGYNILGANENVLKMFLSGSDGKNLNGMMFGSREYIRGIAEFLEEAKKEKAGDVKIACLYYPEINMFRDMKDIQIKIVDLDISK